MRDPEEPIRALPRAQFPRTTQSKITDSYGHTNTDNTVKFDNKIEGQRKICVIKHGRKHDQTQEPKSNIGDPEDIPSRTNKNKKQTFYQI